jgi:subtilisin family serine protease
MSAYFRRFVSSFAITIFLFALASIPTFANIKSANNNVTSNLDFVPGQVLVKYKNPPKSSAEESKIGAQNLSARSLPFTKLQIPSAENTTPKIGAASVNSAKQETLDFIAELKKDPNVEYAEPNYIFRASGFESDDPLYAQGSLWGLNNQGQYGMTADIDINAPEGWGKIVNTGENIKIAILDSGVDYNHEDLRENIDLKDLNGGVVVGNINGYNFCTGQNCEQGNSEDPMDNYGHGTSVAGIAAAVGNNGLGAVGACPRCKIIPVKVLDQYGFGDLMSVTLGIYYAIDNGARVINLSLAAGGITSEFTSKAIAEAVSKNIIVTTVAGNCGDSSFSPAICQHQNQAVYPAVDPNVIAVGSVDAYGNKSSFSNSNEYVFLAAPGEGIYTVCLGGGYCRLTGTSASSPFVAGSVGLLLSQNTNLNLHSIKTILQSSAKDLGSPGYDVETGFGLPNLNAAIDQYTQACDQPGDDVFCVEYYNNPYFAGLPTIKTTENGMSIKREWTKSQPQFLYQNNNYAIRYIGSFDFKNMLYTIKTQGGSGKFYLDDMTNPKVSYSGNGQNINQNTFNVSAGKHLIKFEFTQNEVIADSLLEITPQNRVDFIPFPLDKYLGTINETVKITAGDFNGDGKSDLIKQEKTAATNNLWATRVYLSKGDSTFLAPIDILSKSSFRGDIVEIIPGDFNGDKKTDIIRQERNSWIDGFHDTEVYLSNGDGTFGAPFDITNMSSFRGDKVDIIPGDFNGDGKTDVIRQEKLGWIDGNRDTEVYLSNGDGTFANPFEITDMKAFDGRKVDIIPGDFNGDKKTDIIRQERNVWIDGYRDTEVYLSNGDGTFASPTSITDMKAFDGRQVEIIPGDFDGDGKADIIRQERNSWIDGYRDTEVYLSNGDGTFANPFEITDMKAFDGKITDIIPGDVDGNGKTDVIRWERRGALDGVRDIELYLSGYTST